MKILVAGGAGFIGSHTCVSLLKKEYEVIIADNFSNASKKVIDAIEQITGKKVILYEGDLQNSAFVKKILEKHQVEAILNFAGLKSVGESVLKPLAYYHNNLLCHLNLLDAAIEYNIRVFIFSSSATVYGQPLYLPIDEAHPLSSLNPYGATKLMIEQILKDVYQAHPHMSIMALRYFNPVGADKSALIGERPNDTPANLVPYAIDVALGKRPCVNVFGNDYPTPDGTGIRDYIHIQDLALGHIRALETAHRQKGFFVYNLGTGKGHSVLEVIHTLETVSGQHIPYEIKSRRPGDCASCYADTQKAKKELSFTAEKTLLEMCEDAWRFATIERNRF